MVFPSCMYACCVLLLLRWNNIVQQRSSVCFAIQYIRTKLPGDRSCSDLCYKGLEADLTSIHN